ncbi:MAG: acyl-phosphate glycerol 3-phosphate acyltransferase [Desulfobulbus propionicus]|nr:MAG: acyl-phosphate glycerol 3-phosphate acyltransferase [Desulfobulbus propionicus]
MFWLSFFCILMSYTLGAVPFGILVTRHSGIDIRTGGSGNIGATNVARLLGKKWGLLTLFLDIAKGYFPLFVCAVLVREHAPVVVALCGCATVLGHMYSMFLGFKGGKGVATALGVFFYLSLPAVIACLAIFVAVVAFSGFVSLGSLAGSASMIVILLVMQEPVWKIGLAVFIVAMIWMKHYQNIQRLLSGTEKSWKKR